MSKLSNEDLVKRIHSGIKEIEKSSPWKSEFESTQTMMNAIMRDNGRRLVRLLKAAIGEECNEFSVFFPSMKE